MLRMSGLALSAAILVLVGCGGSNPAATDGPPTLTAIADQSTAIDVPIDVAVMISDEAPASVTMSATSANPALIDGSGLVFSGSGATRTLTLSPKPGQTGTAGITVTATDAASQSGSTAFDFTVETAPPGGPFTWSQLLLASDGDAGSDFGHSIRASGDLIAVGTRDALESGTIYVFRNQLGTWTETWKLSELGSFFGALIALDGDFLASAKSGTTYLYSRDTPAADSWTAEGTLATSGSMDLSGDRLLIVNGAQVATVYTRDAGSWAGTGNLDPGGLAGDDAFGSAVALDGDVAVIGATGDDDGGVDTGAVYVFRYDGSWTLEQKLTAAASQANDRFGGKVAVEGDLILVGVPYISGGAGSGAAYVFTRAGGTWTEAAKLAEGAAGDLFGIAVDIDGGELLIGASRAADDGRSGAAYHYTGAGSSWTGLRLNGMGSHEFDGIGASVAIDGDVVVLGAPGDDDQGSGSGSAQVFGR